VDLATALAVARGEDEQPRPVGPELAPADPRPVDELGGEIGSRKRRGRRLRVLDARRRGPWKIADASRDLPVPAAAGEDEEGREQEESPN
jgi:hypothetical protein